MKDDGTVWAVGSNTSGQLGDGTTTTRSYPVAVKSANGTNFNSVKEISSFLSHATFLQEDNSLWTVGSNQWGQLGDGTFINRNNPVFVMSGVSSLSDQPLDLYDPSEHSAEIVNSEIRAEVATTESLLVSIKIDGSVDLLLRGLDASLANGVGDPNITLYDSDSNVILQNDDWEQVVQRVQCNPGNVSI